MAQCTIPLLISDIGLEPSRIHVVDFVDNRHRIADSMAKGVTYEQDRLTQENMDQFLSSRLQDGDILLDLAWNIDCPTILQWCFDHNVRYLNTSVEVWDPYEDLASTNPLDRTLYVRHQDLRRLKQKWGRLGATAVLEHGANPGLVSHFAKQALEEIAASLLKDGRATGDRAKGLESALAAGQHNMLAMLTGTKVIHVSERDTQLAIEPKRVNEFVNTWSVDGLYEEGIAPAELGWGTHEKTLPRNAWVHQDDGPCNQICIARPGMETWVRSWVPAGEIRGMVVRHGEAYTMTNHLTVWDENGKAIYRPTSHYAYCPSDAAIMSVHELLMRNYEMQPEQRILNDEIVQGQDQLGVLLMGHDYRSWWTGSLLDIHEARSLVPNQSATTLQVASSVMSAVKWMIAEPEAGVVVPDDMPWKFILDSAKPYLGTFHSQAVDWDPLQSRRDVFDQWSDSASTLDPSDPWQFGNFLCH